MGRKTKQLDIDGVGVDNVKARFANTFEVDATDDKYLAVDEEVVYVVVARVSTPSFRESRQGDVSRVDVLKVKEAKIIRSETLRTKVLDDLGFEIKPNPSMFDDTEEEIEQDQGSWLLDDGDILLADGTDGAEDWSDEDLELAPSQTVSPPWGEEEEEDVPRKGPGGGRIVDRAVGAEGHDSVLANFLNS